MDINRLHAISDPIERARAMNEALPDGLDKLMKIEFISVDSKYLLAQMPVAGNNQPFGILHGGANAVLAESMASIAALFLVEPGDRAVGIQVAMTHHASAKSGIVKGEAFLIHAGRSIATYDVKIHNEDNVLSSSGQVICFLKRS